MNVFLIGTGGGVGRRLAAALFARGDTATGMHRKTEQHDVVAHAGSVNGPTAFLYCTTLDALLADDETGVFVYDDGEAACADDPRNQD